MTVEKLGIPVAPVVTQMFVNVVKGVAFEQAMPNVRFTFVHHPVANRPVAECREYILGNDPITKKPVVGEIAAALTSPLTTEEKKTGFIERPRERLVKPDTAEKPATRLPCQWMDGWDADRASHGRGCGCDAERDQPQA